jgi:hypothetical protein
MSLYALLHLWYAQHVLGTSMPIIRSPRLYLCICRLWCAVLGCWLSGVRYRATECASRKGVLHESCSTPLQGAYYSILLKLMMIKLMMVWSWCDYTETCRSCFNVILLLLPIALWPYQFGLGFLYKVSEQYCFTGWGCQPHAHPPAILEDRWFSVGVVSLSWPVPILKRRELAFRPYMT